MAPSSTAGLRLTLKLSPKPGGGMGRPLPGILRLLEWEATQDPLTSLGALGALALGATLIRGRETAPLCIFPKVRHGM